MRLSTEAIELLLQASHGEGPILVPSMVGQRLIRAGSKDFGEGATPREWARWDDAVQQLLREDLIVQRDHKGEFFEVTRKGYMLADNIRTHAGA